MARSLTAALAGASMALIVAGAAHGSGPGTPAPWYLDQFGGEAADLKAFYTGRVGIVMARSPRPELLIDWRLLHGLPVGQAAGESLSIPCCSEPWRPWKTERPEDPVDQWVKTRKLVPGAPVLADRDIGTERSGKDFTDVPNCQGDAFSTAAATLQDRAKRYGAQSPMVAAWLATQDAVFRACSASGVVLPPLPPNAPPWLKADHEYQNAAFDLYDDRAGQAAIRFAAIGEDPASPWRPLGLYLEARAMERQAMAHQSLNEIKQARALIDALAASAPGTYGRDQAQDLSDILEFRFAPDHRMHEIDGDLAKTRPPKTIDVEFRDYSDLADQAKTKPEIIDWMTTLAARPPGQYDSYDPRGLNRPLFAKARIAALAHAVERWRATHDRAWLIAALSLADANSPEATDLVIDGRRVDSAYPGWIAIQYHLLRLRIAKPGARVALDEILAHRDLSVSDRNIFTALRLAVARNPSEFVRLALRRRLCAGAEPETKGCVRIDWDSDDIQLGGVFEGPHGEGSVGLGEDARAVIDRLPMRERIAVSRDVVLPARLRLDIALTSFARAVQLQDEAALDALANELAPLLPQLADEWRRIPAARSGPDKRFAAYMVLAKIPGMRTDLVDYVRPEGPVVQFQEHWMDWIILPKGRGDRGLKPPPLSQYQSDGYDPEGADERSDLYCLGECGRGAGPLRLPDFAARLQTSAMAERAYFVRRADTEITYDIDTGKPPVPPPMPTGAKDVWEEMLAYAAAHPADSRIPEALHWLVHASHFGASHNHSGRRAFDLLQHRYPNSVWARRTPSYSE